MKKRLTDIEGVSFTGLGRLVCAVKATRHDPAVPEIGTAPDVVVGLGNEIAGDDGVGIEVAHLLSARFAACPNVDVIALPWAGFALLDVLRGRTRAAIIDSLITGCHPAGTIVRMDETDMGGSVRLNSFHDISYPTVMALGREMGWDMPGEVAIWGIEAASIDTFSESLSSQVAAAVPVAADQVGRFLQTSPNRHFETTARNDPRYPYRE
jgi:hydrogenase maturation protease